MEGAGLSQPGSPLRPGGIVHIVSLMRGVIWEDAAGLRLGEDPFFRGGIGAALGLSLFAGAGLGVVGTFEFGP